MVVVSIDALGSKWVQREVGLAREQAGKRTDEFKVITLVLPGVPKGLLNLLFPNKPVHIFVKDTPTGFNDAMPELFAVLGERLPNDWGFQKARRSFCGCISVVFRFAWLRMLWTFANRWVL